MTLLIAKCVQVQVTCSSIVYCWRVLQIISYACLLQQEREQIDEKASISIVAACSLGVGREGQPA